MKALLLSCMLSACAVSALADSIVIPSRCWISSEWSNHRIVTWVNDEPMQVCNLAYSDYNKPLKPMLSTGTNTVHFTTERLPERKGSTTINLMDLGLRVKYAVATWTTDKDKDVSPRYTMVEEDGFRPSVDGFDDVGQIDEGKKAEIQAFFKKLREALEKKDLKIAGFSEEKFDAKMRKFGFKKNVTEEVYKSQTYRVVATPLSNIGYIAGHKTILAFSLDGQKLLEAGPDPDAPEEKSKGQYSVSLDSMWFVLKEGKLQPLW